MSSKQPNAAPKPGEPSYRDPSERRLASPPPPRTRIFRDGRNQVSPSIDRLTTLARSDERKRLLLERVLKAVDGVEARSRYGTLLADIEAELSKG